MSPRLRILLGLVLIAALIAPLLPLALWSVARGWFFPQILPANWTIEPWMQAFAPRSEIPSALATTTLIALAAAALALALGIPAGRALGLYRFRGKALVELALLAPVIVPGIAVGLGIHGVFLRLGLTNSVPGVVLVHLVPTLPYVIFVMSGVFANYDAEAEAQARSLGARPLQVLWHVMLPAIAPGIVVAGLFAFLVSWSQYILTLTIGGGRVVTLPLLLYAQAGAGRNDQAGVLAMLSLGPGLVILALVARQLTGRGMAIGGTR
ncbi:putative spermidine/putrescine transport system permease protein [Limimaricola soesokkakensis]|uniref:Inner membrane ABC transporter permease protein YcjP n=1 Tax=Limimaricola soesokkakensis TaxID=1343159 RepID=A0A1X6YZG0_9RHOB|nr:ABC transporter permease subunit [Limimaricola soesokkakensis]PSK87875.1 putative spermidine/putrescine transport system permease protein [Limimaricola soesokkakensis]SLN35384.1 Inner membrane ABC transporter permease protein YcjP [Limimaricola soesokkakensis]